MATEREYQQRLDQFAALLKTLSDQLGSGLVSDPTQADELVQQIDAQVGAWEASDDATPPPPDGGLSRLAGVGPDAAPDLGDARIPQGVKAYDEQIPSERIVA